MAKSKNKQQKFSEYDLINQIVSGYGGNMEARDLRASNPVEGYELTNPYADYVADIESQAQANTINAGVYYDAEGNERPMSELDDAGWWDSGINDSGKLLRKSTDLILFDGTLASEAETRKAIENGVNPDFAEAVGKMAAKDLAVRASQRGETFSSILDMLALGGVGRTELNTRLVSNKLVPFYHPEKKEWVLKQATEDDLKAGAATLSAYGATNESDGFAQSFIKGLSNGLGKTLPLIYNASEAATDLSEATWNFATGNDFKSFDKGSTDELAERYRQGSESGQAVQSMESQDIFSPEGLASGLGQGVASLGQFAGIGGTTASLYNGFGALSSKQALKMFGSGTINNLNKAGIFTAGMILNGGEAYESAKQAGLNEEDAATMFLAVGAINSLVEMGLGANKMQNWLIGDKGVKQVPKIILEETGGDLSKLNSVKDNILSRVIDKVNRFTEIPIIGQAAEEASEEFIQTLVGATGEFLYNKINPNKGTEGDGLFESKNLSEVFKEAFGAAAIGALLGGAAGTLNRNATKEKQDILPFIVDGKKDLVQSTLAEMAEEGMIDPETYEAYSDRINKLDAVWKTNKNVFSKISDIEGIDDVAVKSHVLNLIDSEFELKEDKKTISKKIAEVNGDSELSDAVKAEKVKQLTNQLGVIDTQLLNLSNQISDFIPDDNGQIGYTKKRDAYNEIKDYIMKSANRITEINEEEFDSVFNYSTVSNELNTVLNNVVEEGLTPENKELIKQIVGLDNKESFLQSVVNIREGITKRKEEEKARQQELENQRIKERKQKIKEKAANVKKTEVAEQTTETDDDELTFAPATLKNADGEVIEQPPIEETTDNENIEVPSETSNQELVLQEAEVAPEIDLTTELTPEESAISKEINQEESYTQALALKQDGLVRNQDEKTKNDNSYRLVDMTDKRVVGSTITSLNVNYAQNVLGNTQSQQDEYRIYDSYTEDGRLDINSNFDSRLQDPKQFNVGTQVKLIVPSFAQIQERGIEFNDYTESKYNSDINSIDSFPIAFVDNAGKIVGYLTTSDNIARRVHPDYVKTELAKNRELREKIFENKDSDMYATIVDKTSGTPMFQRNHQSIYDSLGDGNRLAEGVKIAVYKDGRVQTGQGQTFQENIKLPENVTPDAYFNEGSVYSIVPTAVAGEHFALPMDVNPLGESAANTIIKMLELYKATDKFESDASLLQERDDISAEVDFTNFKDTMDAIQSLLYINNDFDNYIFKLDNKKLILGLTPDMQFTWNKFRDPATKDKVREILSKRFNTVRLANFGNPFTSYSLDDNGKLSTNRHKNYFDYLNDNRIITSNIQGEPITGKLNERYFTAQSVIEIGNFSITPKQLVSNNNLNLDNIIIEDNFPNYDNNEANTFAIAIPVGNSNNLDIIGHISVNPETGHISSTLGSYGSVIEPEYRRKGIAFKAYIKVASKLAEKNITLKSDEGGKNNMNESSISLWNKLVDEGYAIDRGNYYEIINISASEEVSPTETTVSTTEEKKAPAKPKNKLGLKVPTNRNKPRIDEDFAQIIINDSISLDKQAEALMKKCSE